MCHHHNNIDEVPRRTDASFRFSAATEKRQQHKHVCAQRLVDVVLSGPGVPESVSVKVTPVGVSPCVWMHHTTENP
ncbi:hypothetical protein ROHU_009484 [Labeo rohita]|uniref:Uncharacterized protein n=1 Tax=Labeo rohita TaxID=84645 RepID=A0A498M2N2_LABRO|nr:hypothetical protein ROHU_009484 [Labeo rohita]